MENAEKIWDSGKRSISRGMNLNIANWGMDEAFTRSRASSRSRTSFVVDDDEEALRWAAIERLPTYNRMRTGILRSTIRQHDGDNVNQLRQKKYEHKEVDVRKLETAERQEFISRLFKVAEEDNERFLKKLRDRIDK